MPVLRSTWCGRRSSPVSLSSTNELAPSAWCERRMLRREGDTFRLGTAIFVSLILQIAESLRYGSQARKSCRAEKTVRKAGLMPQAKPHIKGQSLSETLKNNFGRYASGIRREFRPNQAIFHSGNVQFQNCYMGL